MLGAGAICGSNGDGAVHSRAERHVRAWAERRHVRKLPGARQLARERVVYAAQVARPCRLVVGAARLDGKSSLGRLGLLTHATAGFVDAGWDGHLTLELSNVATLPIAIYPGMKIGQISFFRMTTPADHPYGSDATDSKYQGQRGPTPSRYYLNFRDRD